MENKFLKFLDPTDWGKYAWAMRYFKRHFKYAINQHLEFDYGGCISCLNRLSDTDRELLYTKMSGAWRSEKLRSGKKDKRKKQCSYILKEDSMAELKTLAITWKVPISEALERAVKKAYNQERRKAQKVKPTSITPKVII